jgi:hypothetical protein
MDREDEELNGCTFYPEVHENPFKDKAVNEKEVQEQLKRSMLEAIETARSK